MMLTCLLFDNHKHYYLLLGDNLRLSGWFLEQDDYTRQLEEKSRSHFWRHRASNSLCKLVADKYPRWSLGWFCRDMFGKRLIGQIDAFREARSNEVIRKAGIDVVFCKAAGLALNPLNPLGSFLAMQHLQDHQSCEEYFRLADEPHRLALLRLIADDIFLLAKLGYCHRDLHLGNLMLAPSGTIVWIDTHVRHLPLRQTHRKQALIASLQPGKLFGQRYRYYLLHQLTQLVKAK